MQDIFPSTASPIFYPYVYVWIIYIYIILYINIYVSLFLYVFASQRVPTTVSFLAWTIDASQQKWEKGRVPRIKPAIELNGSSQGINLNTVTSPALFKACYIVIFVDYIYWLTSYGSESALTKTCRSLLNHGWLAPFSCITQSFSPTIAPLHDALTCCYWLPCKWDPVRLHVLTCWDWCIDRERFKDVQRHEFMGGRNLGN